MFNKKLDNTVRNENKNFEIISKDLGFSAPLNMIVARAAELYFLDVDKGVSKRTQEANEAKIVRTLRESAKELEAFYNNKLKETK